MLSDYIWQGKARVTPLIERYRPEALNWDVSHTKGLLKGTKFNGRHSTVISSAIPVVEAARDCPHVTKIALGVITPIRAAEERLKFTTVSGGLKMQVRGTHAVQIFWLYTTRPEDVIAEITNKWNERDRP